MAKKILLFLFIFLVPCFMYGRGNSDTTIKDLTIYGLKGPTGVGIIQLFENPPVIPGFNVKLEALSQADLLAALFISGEAKVGLLPANMAAKIASSGKDIRCLAVVGTGMLSLLSSDASVHSIEDLKGKSVQVAGQGATPDYVFRRILISKGLDPNKDLSLEYALAYPEIAQSLIAGRISLALIPEPFTTMALMGKPDLRTISDIQQEWIKSGGGSNYPMTVLVVDGAFASANSDAVAAIAAAVKNSIDWVVKNPAQAGSLVEKYELGLRAAVVAAAIPKSNYVFITAQEARSALEALFKVFLENSAASIGGVLPQDRFYY